MQLAWFHLNMQEELNCLVYDQETAWMAYEHVAAQKTQMVYEHAAVWEVHQIVYEHVAARKTQMVYEHTVPQKTQMVFKHAAALEVHPL